MSDTKEYYKETVERYCHVVGKNITFDRYTSGSDRHFECSAWQECEKNGGCRHHVFSKNNMKKRKEG